MVTVFASKQGSIVRVQAWHGDIAESQSPALCASFHLTVAMTEKLIAQLREAVEAMPRVGTAADLGCEVL